MGSSRSRRSRGSDLFNQGDSARKRVRKVDKRTAKRLRILNAQEAWRKNGYKKTTCKNVSQTVTGFSTPEAHRTPSKIWQLKTPVPGICDNADGNGTPGHKVTRGSDGLRIVVDENYSLQRHRGTPVTSELARIICQMAYQPTPQLRAVLEKSKLIMASTGCPSMETIAAFTCTSLSTVKKVLLYYRETGKPGPPPRKKRIDANPAS